MVYIHPEEWNEFIKKDDVILIDTTGKSLTTITSFINSVNPLQLLSEIFSFVQNNQIFFK